MATIANLTGAVTLSINGAVAEIASFEIPVRTQGSDANPTVVIDRTHLREQVDAAATKLIEFTETALAKEPAGQVLLICEVCGSQLATSTLAVLRHEGDGAHVLEPS